VTAAALVAALQNAGVRLRVVAGRLDLEADREPPRELLDELTRRKVEVLAHLAERDAPPPPAPKAPVPASDAELREICFGNSRGRGGL